MILGCTIFYFFPWTVYVYLYFYLFLLTFYKGPHYIGLLYKVCLTALLYLGSAPCWMWTPTFLFYSLSFAHSDVHSRVNIFTPGVAMNYMSSHSLPSYSLPSSHPLFLYIQLQYRCPKNIHTYISACLMLIGFVQLRIQDDVIGSLETRDLERSGPPLYLASSNADSVLISCLCI